MLFINGLCWVLLSEGINAKGGRERPLDKITLFKEEGSKGAVVKSEKRDSNRCSWVGHYTGTDGFLFDLVVNTGRDLEQIIWFPGDSVP